MGKILKQSGWEYLVPGLAGVSLLISCVIVSSKKFFWNDELLSFYLLNDRYNDKLVDFAGISGFANHT